MDKNSTKEYWENYVNYWEKKVEEANRPEVKGDKTMSEKELMNYSRMLSLQPGDTFLDFGCGSLRFYPIYQEFTGQKGTGYFGVDIARTPLEHGLHLYPDINPERLTDFDGLHIPYEDDMFDKILCWGVFDACSQEEILSGLLRVLKPGGKLLITGKNTRYFPDDNAAYEAEVNARKKGHPNYFTDVSIMMDQLQRMKYKMEQAFYFLRRGDFVNEKMVREEPPVFYEWLLIIQKNTDSELTAFPKFSSEYSETYQKGEHK